MRVSRPLWRPAITMKGNGTSLGTPAGGAAVGALKTIGPSGAENRALDPISLDAVTSERTSLPESAADRAYERDVRPGTGVQLASLASSHRYHA